MKRFAVIALFGLTACVQPANYAPANIDFSTLSFANQDDAFDGFTNAAYSFAVAGVLAEDCPDFGFDAREQDFVIAAMDDELARLYAGDDAGFRAFVYRLTGDASATSLDDSEGLSTEVTGIMTDRVVAYFREHGAVLGEDFGQHACGAAETEKQTGSLIGRFLFRE